MQHNQIIEQLIEQITERLHKCTDEGLLDFVLKLLIESGY